jgi:hypothetical protein
VVLKSESVEVVKSSGLPVVNRPWTTSKSSVGF